MVYGGYDNLKLTRVERGLRIAAVGKRQREPRCSCSYWTPPRAMSGNLIMYRDSGFGVLLCGWSPRKIGVKTPLGMQSRGLHVLLRWRPYIVDISSESKMYIFLPLCTVFF